MIVLGGNVACEITEEAVLAAIEGKFEFKILDVSHSDLCPAAGGLFSIGYLMAFVDLYMGRNTGEDTIGTIPGEYLKPSRLMKVANIALENQQRVAKIDGYRPFEMWGTSALDVVRKEVRLQGRFSTEVSIIAASIPVAFEVLLCSMDQYVAENRAEYERTADTNDSHVDEREWAVEKIKPKLTKLLLFPRTGRKAPRARLERFWNCLFKDVKGMPPFESSLPVFTTMRRFNGSFLLSIGLELVYGKDSTLGNVPTERPSYPAECNPWKIFNHGLRVGVDNARVAGWFKKEAWGRMQEAGVVMLGFTGEGVLVS